MRQLNINRVTSRKIDVVGNISELNVDKNGDLLSTLTTLFPEKKGYWNKKHWKSLRVSFLPNIPFGPDPEVLGSFLFDNLEDDLQMLIKEYGLKSIVPYGIREKNNESRKDLNLTAWEMKKLVEVTRQNKYTAQYPLSVFVDPDSVYSYSISPDLSFTDLFESADHLRKLNIEDFVDTVNGEALNGDSLVSSSSITHISDKSWRFDSSSNFLFTYPNFNRKISMMKNIDKTEDPCINCLACAAVCPADLYPALLYHHLKEENLAEANAMGLQLCMSCRRCSVACPSNIPLSALLIKTISSERGDDA